MSEFDLKEHSPMIGLDEYPVHQFPEPIRIVASSDPRAYERYWFSCHDTSGELFLTTGFGIYPVLNTAEAYSIFVHKNTHVSVRSYRLLGDDRMNMTCGPIKAEIISPFREWRLTLGENDQGLRYDVRWKDTKRAVFQRYLGVMIPSSKDGRLSPEGAGYESYGTIEGTIEYMGKTFTIDPASCTGCRDHHWGTRNGVGGPSMSIQDHSLENVNDLIPGTNTPNPLKHHSHMGQYVAFKERGLFLNRAMYNLGDKRPGAGRIQTVDARLKFNPVTKALMGGIVRNRLLDTGEIMEIKYEQIDNMITYLRCGGYEGPTGGTPDDNIYHGMYVGDNVVRGETYDTSDPKLQLHLMGFDHHLCKATCNGETVVGILECRDPILYEYCRIGRPGYSFLEE